LRARVLASLQLVGLRRLAMTSGAVLQLSRLLEPLDRCSLVALTLREAGVDDSARERQVPERPRI